jgi:hypothetical protein
MQAGTGEGQSGQEIMMVVVKVEGVAFGNDRWREPVKDDRQRFYRLKETFGVGTLVTKL